MPIVYMMPYDADGGDDDDVVNGTNSVCMGLYREA